MQRHDLQQSTEAALRIIQDHALKLLAAALVAQRFDPPGSAVYTQMQDAERLAIEIRRIAGDLICSRVQPHSAYFSSGLASPLSSPTSPI